MLIVFGSFILHGNGGEGCRCVDTFHSSTARLNGVGRQRKGGGWREEMGNRYMEERSGVRWKWVEEEEKQCLKGEGIRMWKICTLF